MWVVLRLFEGNKPRAVITLEPIERADPDKAFVVLRHRNGIIGRQAFSFSEMGKKMSALLLRGQILRSKHQDEHAFNQPKHCSYLF